ncbi:metal ABC transporter substrate-binding protein [Herbiconiux sp. SYSU D00978]|uniref:metal ABC transporter substrate-binding protein n=1 Tax=Herbiconiux sp. SYSU D00978 TaxID=2812562 RepID=UPI001A96CA1D|nr:metal ABC transporter substrate-binding protein [Herbiconiux sp. SYSU D00978]
MRRLVPTALLASSALLLAGCATSATPAGGSSSAAGAGGEGLSIVATTTVVADFTRNIVGDAASVTQLIQPNQSSHSYDPSAADLTALGTADVLVVNGAGLEEWLDDAISASGFDGTLIDSSEGIELAEGAEAHAHEHEGEEHADEEHAEEEGEAHEHAEDPHIWTDPGNALVQVQNIADGLIEADDANADAFAQNAEDYEAKLTALDEWITASVEQVPAEQRLLVTNHDAFGYFVSAYGLTYVGAVIPSLDDNAEVSAAEIDELVHEIEHTGAKAVFSETSLSPAAAETIASEAGVEVYAGDDALYADSLGPVGSSGATYIDSIEHNVTLLVQSWGAEPTPLPEVLSQ